MESLPVHSLNIQALLKIVGDKMPEAAAIIENIQYAELYASKQDVSNWQSAREIAEFVRTPDNALLMRVFNDVIVDCHITGIINSIKNKIKAKKFKIISKDSKEEDEALTEIFEQEWFYNFVDYCIEAAFFKYSILQLGNYYEEIGFKDLTLIPREYCTPQKLFIKKYLWINLVSGSGNDILNPSAGWSYKSEELKNFILPIISNSRLGLLDNAAPHALGKKHIMIYCWRFCEIFGIPWRVGKTDTNDNRRRKHMEDVLNKAGNSQSIVMNNNDEVELISGAATDVSRIFLEPMKYSNNEITKAFAGAVGIFDEKNFVGSAESGERLFEEFVTAFARTINFVTNNELIPRMVEGYHRTEFVNKKFVWDNEEKLTLTQKIEVVKTILSGPYTITPETIDDLFGIEVEVKEAQPFPGFGQPTQENTPQQVAAFYHDYLKKNK